MTKPAPWTLQPAAARPRETAAAALRGASVALARMARRLHVAPRATRTAEPVFEFYAEAGAPEGALYVDGQRVGVLQGVVRL